MACDRAIGFASQTANGLRSFDDALVSYEVANRRALFGEGSRGCVGAADIGSTAHFL